MEFRVLGPLEVLDAGRPVRLGGPRAEKVLATLLLAGGAVIGPDGLTDALWDGEPPPTATHQVHKAIAGLRARLPGHIDTVGTGYRIRADDLDLARFTDLVAAGALTQALDLWRGPALAGIDGRTLRAAAARLDDRRLAAVEASVELRLAAGDAGAGLAAELAGLIAAHPLRETLRRQLMVALYRCGRQADALAVYAETRALLARELGVDPGPDLVRVHQQVLRADPALDRPGAAPCTLPYDLPDFAGRTADLTRLLEPAPGGAVVISAIDGMAGIGKTALAVHAAHRLAPSYPDGQLFCDLHAHTAGAAPLTPAAALERLLRMLGVPPEAIPEDLDGRAARWRAELAGRRVLVVLDNAAGAAQVRPLLPGSPRSLVLVTSRRRLGVLEGATVLSLDVLPPAEAVALFAAVAGVSDPAAAEVVELCGFLPLAIRIAATRLAHRPEWTVATLAGRLRSARLAELTLADRGVGPAFALSYGQLAPAERRLFRLLGLHPGTDFDAWSAAALAGTTPARAEALLESLVDAHLLRPYGANRYTFHDLLRSYAREVAPKDGGRRLHDYFLAAATAATDLVSPGTRRFTPAAAPPRHLPALSDVDDALAWLAAEHHTLVAIALGADDWQLACVLRTYFEHRGHFADWRATSEHALAHADPLGTVLLRFGLGSLAMWTDRLAEGMEHFRLALAGADPDIEAAALTSLGMLAHLDGRDAEAAGYLRRALTHEGRTAALARNNLGLAEARLGRGATALSLHREALATADSAAATRAILLGLGETSLRLGLPAERPFREALALARAGRFRMQEALALDGLAHATGDPAWWRPALTILTELGVERAGLVRRHLADPAGRWCDLCQAPSTVDDARPAVLLRR
ncbi:MAG TPA: BTAD domain-containing putative transcriptional regulator [Mycobacteriales bacterium]|nr:BTAD domain-containing putative transcriptional regulator [Mycobacteriales bacterium]